MAANNATMRANNPIAPAQRLKVLARLVCVLELRLVEDWFSHDFLRYG
jgi:hypothetical protein